MNQGRTNFGISLYSLVFTLSIFLTSFDVQSQEVLVDELKISNAVPSRSHGKFKIEKLTTKYMCVGKHDGYSYPCDIESTLFGILGNEGIERFRIENLISNLPDLSACTNTAGLDLEELFIKGGHVLEEPAEQKGGITMDASSNRTEGTSNFLLDGSAAGEGRYFVKGLTKTDVASELTYDTPIRSGIYSAITYLVAPPHPSSRFVWIFTSSGRTTSYIYERHIIRIAGLKRLPGCPDSNPISGQQYVLARGDVGPHPEGHWGRDKTLQIAIELANKVFKDHTRHMSYNDLSLPLGGYSHHVTHRTGRDIDINAKNRMKYDCNNRADKDKFIQKAFTDLYGLNSLVKGKKATSDTDKINDRNFPNLHCYESGVMHIDAVSGF